MWVFTKEAFLSVVENKLDPKTLLVRSRVEGDIERLWPNAEVRHTPMSDYAYRAAMSRQEVAAGIANSILEIDYNNYKNSITDKRRGPFYMMVWDVMWRMQNEMWLKPR